MYHLEKSSVYKAYTCLVYLFLNVVHTYCYIYIYTKHGLLHNYVNLYLAGCGCEFFLAALHFICILHSYYCIVTFDFCEAILIIYELATSCTGADYNL